jgi:hypothetical protein
MKLTLRTTLLTLLLSIVFSSAWADNYSDKKKMFENAGLTHMFKTAFGYALFPTIGKAGFVVGGAYGKGRVYAGGKYYGDTAMTGDHRLPTWWVRFQPGSFFSGQTCIRRVHQWQF